MASTDLRGVSLESAFAPALALLLGAASTLFPADLDAQRRGKTQEQLREQREEKLKKPFVTFAPWILNYDKARLAAKKQDKLILAYFTRSYSP